jgi:hypothetical protein
MVFRRLRTAHSDWPPRPANPRIAHEAPRVFLGFLSVRSFQARRRVPKWERSKPAGRRGKREHGSRNSCHLLSSRKPKRPIDIYAGDGAGRRKVRARQTLTCQKASARVLGFPSKRRWQDVMDNPRVRAKSVASPDRAKPRLNGVEEERETGKTTGTMPQELRLMRPFPKWNRRSRLEGGSTGPGAPQGVSCGSNDRGRRACRSAPWS